MLTERILSFAELGRLAFNLTSDFAETITDPDVLDDVQEVLEMDAGAIDRLYDVMLDGETFSGKAEQRISLAKSRVFEFRISPTRIYFKPLNAAEMAEYVDTDEGWSEIVEFAAKSGKAGKKLNCKAGNYQCGGACINESRGCSKNPNMKQQTTIKQAAAKAKKTTSKPAPKTATPKQPKAKATPKTEQSLDALKTGYDQEANEGSSYFKGKLKTWEASDMHRLMSAYADEISAPGGKVNSKIADEFKQGNTNLTVALVRQPQSDEYDAIGQQSKDLIASATDAGENTRAWRVSVPDIPEQIEVAEALQRFPDLANPANMRPASSNAKLMSLYSDEITKSGVKQHAATDADIEEAAKTLLKNNGRQWLPTIVREIEEDSGTRYEVIGNHFVHEVAQRAGLNRTWAIIAETEDRRKKL